MWKKRIVFEYNKSRDENALSSIDSAFTRTDITLTGIEDVLIRRYFDEKDANKKNDLYHDISAVRRTRELLATLSNEYREIDNEKFRKLDKTVTTNTEEFDVEDEDIYI